MPLAHVLALASGPVLVLLHVIWSVDKHREPFGNVLKYLAVGGLVVVPGCQLERFALAAAGEPIANAAGGSLLGLLVACVLGIGFVEELVKYAGVRWAAARDRQLDEAFDWVVYSVTVALGFAFVENALYVLQYGEEVVASRALLAVPAHALNGTLMGVRLARAATGPERERGGQRALALIEPALWHGAYDFLAFAPGARGDDGPLPGAVYTYAFGLLVVVQWVRCVNQVRAVLVESRPLPPVLYPLARTRFARRAAPPKPTRAS